MHQSHTGLDKSGYQIFFLFLHENICCGYSLEAPCRGTSNEYPQHAFSWRNKKNINRFGLIKSSYQELWSQVLALLPNAEHQVKEEIPILKSLEYNLPTLKVDPPGCSTISDWYIVCVVVLRPSQPNGVMPCAVSLHTFTGQA